MSDMPGGPTPPPPPPPPGTPPGAGGLRPRTLGEILSAAFEIYKANASKFIVIVALVVVPLSLIGALLGELVDPAPEPTDIEPSSAAVGLLLGLIAGAIVLIVWGLLQAAVMRAAALATIGDPVDVEASYKWGFKRLGSVILVSLLAGLAIAFGFVLLIVPGLIFLGFLAVSVPAVVIENRRGTDALKRSWDLVSGNFGHALGVVLVALLITLVVNAILSAIASDNWFVAWIISAIGEMVTVPFAALVSVLLYLDLRARKEALTADSLRAELATNA